MKNLVRVCFALLCASVLLVGCADDKGVRENAANTLDVPAATEGAVTPPSTPAATVNSNVQHYICPNNCAGSGGAAQGTCPVCGTAYQHNAAYHNQPGATNATTTPTTTTTPITTPGNTQVTPPTTASPAQNAAGVWHYTCSAGCAGGAGAAGNCASCGSPLAHNAAYHN